MIDLNELESHAEARFALHPWAREYVTMHRAPDCLTLRSPLPDDSLCIWDTGELVVSVNVEGTVVDWSPDDPRSTTYYTEAVEAAIKRLLGSTLRANALAAYGARLKEHDFTRVGARHAGQFLEYARNGARLAFRLDYNNSGILCLETTYRLLYSQEPTTNILPLRSKLEFEGCVREGWAAMAKSYDRIVQAYDDLKALLAPAIRVSVETSEVRCFG